MNFIAMGAWPDLQYQTFGFFFPLGSSKNTVVYPYNIHAMNILMDNFLRLMFMHLNTLPVCMKVHWLCLASSEAGKER